MLTIKGKKEKIEEKLNLKSKKKQKILKNKNKKNQWKKHKPAMAPVGAADRSSVSSRKGG